MQNETVMRMAIALKRGEPFVEETTDSKNYEFNKTTRQHERKPGKTKALAVRSEARGSSIVLSGDCLYDSGSWAMVARLHEHATKRDKLLVVMTPESTHSQFTTAAHEACALYDVPLVRVMPHCGHPQAREYFDFATWRFVQEAVAVRATYDMYHRIARANECAAERELYSLFFGLRWPSVMGAAPVGLDAISSTLTRKVVEASDVKVPDWRKCAPETPFWIKGSKR